MNIVTLLKTKIEFFKSSKLCSEEIRQMQLRKFRQLVAAITVKSPYYKKIINKHGINPKRCSPDDFPILDKENVIKNFDDIVTDRRITKDRISKFLDASKSPFDLFDNKYHVLHGSGTSGKTSFFVYSKNDFSRGMTHVMDLIPLRLQRRIRIAYLGIAGGHFAGITMVCPSMSPMTRLFCNTKIIEITQPIQQIVEKLNAFQPDIIVGYATVAKVLAEKQREKILNIRPSLVESGGEVLSPEDKKFIEIAFHCHLINIYASTEFLNMGISKPEYGGMYLLENDLIFDLKKDHTLVTSLFNNVMPLIRYRMEDILIPVADDEKILPFTKVSEVIGRNEYAMVLTNKHGADDFVAPDEIYQFFMKDLQQYQVRWVNKQAFIFRTVFKNNVDEFRKKEVRKKLKSKIASFLSVKEMENVSFKIEEFENLPIDPKTGKFRFIIKDAGNEFPCYPQKDVDRSATL
jgi:phenylacetate-coenzyme A ligase PaaK-like adenylate-forming protein